MDCSLCPEHKQHICLALIEVNTGCNLNCPVCFANAGVGYSLTMEQVEFMLDRFVETEGDPEVIQFSGGEPTIHPDLMEMIQAAKDRGIRQIMVNTNGVRIARDDKFLDDLAKQNPVIYFQFDGLRPETYLTIRGEDFLDMKLKALDRLAEKGMDAVLVAAIERGVNTDEVGAILKFGLEHPAVRGVVFQPVTHVGRHIDFDPMERDHLRRDSRHRRSERRPVRTTSPTAPCPSPRIQRTYKRRWKDSGRHRRLPGRSRPPTSSNAPAVRGWNWATSCLT